MMMCVVHSYIQHEGASFIKCVQFLVRVTACLFLNSYIISRKNSMEMLNGA
jgi:hypothetical protein